jgi:hypothetical protein
MRRKAVFSLALVMAVTALNAQDAPSPVTEPTPDSSDAGEPVLPTPDVNPQGSDADLLPKTDELPAVPPKTVRTRRTIIEDGQKEVSANGGRFEEIRLRAMDSPRAAYLLKRAQSSSRAAFRRAYLREYYAALASRMRKLDPNLKYSINAYEESKIREIARSGSAITEGSAHHSRTRHIVSREPQRRSHRMTSRYRYRRLIIIDSPYGPQYPPFGPPPPLYPW